MDRNLLLAFTLSFVVLITWTMLTKPPPPEPGEEGTVVAESSPTDSSTPAEEEPSAAVAPSTPLPPSRSSTAQPTPGPTPTAASPVPQPAVDEIAEQTLSLDLPLFNVELSSRGAGITSWRLHEYRQSADPTSPPVELVTGEAPLATMFTTPFDELGLGDLSQRVFRVVDSYGEGAIFETTSKGVTVRKTYSFEPDTYMFRLLLEVDNQSAAAIAPRFRVDMPARVQEGSDFTQLGLAAFSNGKFENQPLAGFGKAGFFSSFTGGEAKLERDLPGAIDWAGVSANYFLTAVLPDAPEQASVRMFAAQPGVAGVTQVFFDETVVPSGRTAARELRAYVGPKDMDRLEALGAETERSVDLGWSWVHPLTRFFSLFLHVIYSVIPNYGVAIILLTILVRLVTAPLTIKQMRSMERMRALSPKLKELQEKYKDDRQKQSEQTMALYRSEGVNPLGGCLPMLLQFPVFIGLFYALRSTIQLRQSPFFGWIDDLSAPESLFEIPGLGVPFRVLPLVMGGTMFLQQKITPMQADPAQAKMMMTVMPIMMTFVFYRFPSGLVLYWMVSNVLAISHQLWIGRNMRK